VFRTLAEAFDIMRRDGIGGGGGAEAGIAAGNDTTAEEASGVGGDSDLLSQMIQILLRDADTPPREVEGVSEEFCDGYFLPDSPLRCPAQLKRNVGSPHIY
jgi:hypothetical protein